jgi:hypothetical protein
MPAPFPLVDTLINSIRNTFSPPAEPPDPVTPAPEPTPPAPPPEPASEAVEVDLFEDAYIRYDNDNANRTAKSTVDFPEGEFKSAKLRFRLKEPPGGFDFWDRDGRITMVGDDGKEVELARLMTPYRVGGEWELDITHALPLLKGKKDMKAFINTWVGPGHAQGAGWLLDATIELERGDARHTPIAASVMSPETVWFGNPEKPAKREMTFEVPEGAERSSIDLLVTGHGQGNRDNAAEWAKRIHNIRVDGKPIEFEVWRNDCHLPHGVQSGMSDPSYQFSPTYKAPRAGWCPGDKVDTIHLELGKLGPGEHTITYEPERADAEAPWENTCSPEYLAANGEVEGCTLGAPAEYNGNNHTRARYEVSGIVTSWDED